MQLSYYCFENRYYFYEKIMIFFKKNADISKIKRVLVLKDEIYHYEILVSRPTVFKGYLRY